VRRKQKVWTATVTPAGEYYLEHGAFAPSRTPASEAGSFGRGERPEIPRPDNTSMAMRRVRNRTQPEVVHTKREIKETYVRYKVIVTRVQVAERFVRATSEEEAASKVQEEFDRPYGYFGTWKTTASEIDIVEAEKTTVIGPTHVSNDGSLLMSLKDAAKALGISYSTLYQMTGQGDIEWVSIGSRKFIARDVLLEFIRANSHRGYYNAISSLSKSRRLGSEGGTLSRCCSSSTATSPSQATR
jgi:excisionase family DNA binding protein